MLGILLRENGFDTISAYSETEGVLVHSEAFDLILLDLILHGKSGDSIIGELKQKHDENIPRRGAMLISFSATDFSVSISYN